MVIKNMQRNFSRAPRVSVALLCAVAGAGLAHAQAPAPCKEMRKIKIGVSVSPPNVVHTPVYIAQKLGIFARHCIERRPFASSARIFERGLACLKYCATMLIRS